MAEDIKISIGGTDAALLAVWQRQNIQILKNQKALIAMGEAGEQAGNKIGSSLEKQGIGFQKAISHVGQFAASLVGMSAVMRGIQQAAEMIRREYEHLRNQQAAAGQQQIGLAAIQREVFDNLGDDKTLTPAMANARVAQISQATSMKPGDVMQVLSTALSFKERSATAASVLPIVEMAANMYPDNPQAAAAAAKGMQGIAKIAPNAKAKDIQGFLLGAQLASPITNAENFASYGAPAIAQLMSLGNTGKEASAFLGALGQGIGDEEGRITGNAAITFAKQMKELAPNVKGGLIQQLAFLQTPEGQKAKRKLLGPLMAENKRAKEIGLAGEAKSFATLIGFIQGEGRYSEMLAGTLADTPDIEGAGHFVDERQARLAADPLQRNARINRTLESAGERAQLTQTAAGRQGITLARLQEVLTKSGATESELGVLMEAYKVRTEGAPEGFIGKGLQELGLIGKPDELQSPDVAAAGIMRGQARMLETGKRFKSGVPVEQEATAEDLEAAAALRQAADLLEEGAKKKRAPQEAKAGPAAGNNRGGPN